MVVFWVVVSEEHISSIFTLIMKAACPLKRWYTVKILHGTTIRPSSVLTLPQETQIPHMYDCMPGIILHIQTLQQLSFVSHFSGYLKA
jgi:hypothetical protein